MNARSSIQEGKAGDALVLTCDIISPTNRTASIQTEHKSWLYNWEYQGVSGSSYDFKAGVPVRVTFNRPLSGNADTRDWDKICLFAGNMIDVVWLPGINMPCGRGGEALIPAGAYCGAGALNDGVTSPPPLLVLSVAVAPAASRTDMPSGPDDGDPSPPLPLPLPPPNPSNGVSPSELKSWLTTLKSMHDGINLLRQNIGQGELQSGDGSPPVLKSAAPDQGFIALSRSGTGRLVTQLATAKAANETSPYTYSWTRRPGNSQAISADSPKSASTTFSAELATLGTITDVFDVVAVDADGHAAQADRNRDPDRGKLGIRRAMVAPDADPATALSPRPRADFLRRCRYGEGEGAPLAS